MERLGQNFLTNKKKLQEIAKFLDLKSEDTIIEIGPGHGELTDFLILGLQEGKIKKLIAIEKDIILAKALKQKFYQEKNLEIIEGDALKILPELTKNLKNEAENYKIAGNIPYYITGYLLRIISELEPKPSVTVLTIQKEVAERLASQPPKMNLLAASVQFWAKTEIVDYIPKTDFQPQPKVDSATIRLTTYNLKSEAKDSENYYKLLKILFKQPRKTILNNLRSLENNSKILIEKLEKIGINPGDRPQNLSVEKIKELLKTIKA